MNNYPGREFATEHGYHLYSHSPNSATYEKHMENRAIFLKLWEVDGKLRGELDRIIGLASCTIDCFSLPNKNFEKFERQLSLLTNVDEYETVNGFRHVNNSAVDYLYDGITFLAVGIEKRFFPTAMDMLKAELEEDGLWNPEYEKRYDSMMREWNDKHKNDE